MATFKNLDLNFLKAKGLAATLLRTKPVSLTDKMSVPNSGGVYLFHKDKSHMYVGIAKNLRRRIYTDHLSAEFKDSMSALRRSLNKAYELDFGKGMQKWIINNCRIAFVEIDDADMRKMVEACLIVCLRTPHLLNKN